MVMAKIQAQDDQKSTSAWDSFKDASQLEIEQGRRELKEIDLMIEQSQMEVNKLAQRNASVTTHLQQIQAQFDSVPRSDIRTAYDASLDAQQRLFVMRGQMDKLQSDRAQIARYQTLLERVLQIMEGGPVTDNLARSPASMVETVEKMIQAQESERQSLARQMHDGPAQALANFILQTEIAMKLFDIDAAKAKEELGSLKTAATSTFQKVRDFIFELRPMMLDDLGLSPTLSRYVEAYKEQSGIDTRLTVTGLEQRLETYLEVMIFRAVQEFLSNAAQHSSAHQVRVQVDATDANVKVSVEDDGKGFDVAQIEARGGMGLKVVRDRVEMLGGVWDVASVPDQGTRITLQVPATKTKVFA